MPSAAETIVCRVCGEQIGPDGVLSCKDCGTPHHKDCWEFTGGCSVYGCGGSRSSSYALPIAAASDVVIPADEVLKINENTPIPAAYARRRDGFPTPAYFATLAYGNSITGVKLFGTGFAIWLASITLGTVLQPFVFFSVAGCVLLMLSPLYWLAASVLSILSISTGLAEGRIERKAVHAFLVGAFIPLLICLYADLGSLAIGAAGALFIGGFLFQFARNAFLTKFDL
ncbi:MAG: hypothetical protein HY814_04445 [Candidatus Riflebacteria bacterium]|nr:hypothetical protein [Candidatus Riflebacteria bacterium]